MMPPRDGPDWPQATDRHNFRMSIGLPSAQMRDTSKNGEGAVWSKRSLGWLRGFWNEDEAGPAPARRVTL